MSREKLGDSSVDSVMLPSPGSLRERVSSRPGVSLLLLAVTWQLVLAMQPLAFLHAQVLVVDDVFYYLQIARNLAQLGWPTLDGLHATNGVQLLWCALLTPVAWLVPGKLAFVRATLFICVALNLSAGLMLRRFGTLVHSARTGELVAALWACVLLVPNTPTLTGMEYPLHALVIAGSLLAWWPLVSAPELSTRRQVIALAAWLTLNFWTRLDSAYYSAALAMLAGWRLWSRSTEAQSRLGDLMWLAAVMAVGACAYVITCDLMAGTWTPVSGLVKSLYASHYFSGHSWTTAWRERLEWWMQIQAQPLVDLVATPAGVVASTLRAKLLAFVIGVALAGWAAWRAWFRDAGAASVARVVSLVLLLGCGHVALVIGSVAHFSYVTRHYYAWTQVAWCLWLAYALSGALETLVPRARPVAVGLAAAAVVAGQVMAFAPRFDPVALEGLRSGRSRAIAWVEQHLPPGAPIGAWNAGQVSYFLDRPVVNLDGLVNDARYVGVLRGEESLQSYLEHEGIHYLMDYNEVDLSMPYHAYWKRNERFRNAFAWRDLTVLHVEPAGPVEVQVVALTPGRGAARAN